MKNFLRHYLFIISIFTCASICNLKSEDPDGMDFLDKLLKEIEQMESSEGEKKPAYDSDYSKTTQPEPFLPSLDKATPMQERNTEIPKSFIKKDTRTLFLEPDVQEFKRAGKGTKIRPTKDTVLAFKYYSNELNTTSQDINNKLEINQDLPPKFKETKVRELRQELETTNSLIDLIKDKGIYYSNFLKSGKEKPTKGKSYDSTDKHPEVNKNVRKEFLDVLKKLQTLNAELPEPDESKEANIELIQQLATQKHKSELPKYKPLAPSYATPTATKKPASAKQSVKPESLFKDDDDDDAEMLEDK